MTGSDSTVGNWFQPPIDGGHGLVRLVEGSTFCVAERSADIHPGRSEGLYFLDTRLVSKLVLAVDRAPIEPLSVQTDEPFSAVHVARASRGAGEADTPVTIVRRRHIGAGMRDEIELHNYEVSPTTCEVTIDLDADFADLFEVKGGRPDPGRQREFISGDDGMEIQIRALGEGTVTSVQFHFEPPPDHIEGGSATWRLALPANSKWSACVDVAVSIDNARLDGGHQCGAPDHTTAATARINSWRSSMPSVSTDHPKLAIALEQAQEDLGALRIFDPDHVDRAILAAGAPWFMTLFGRDSLLAGWMALMADPTLALGAVQTLAELQGQEVRPATEEQPGRILHEVRLGHNASLSFRSGEVFYGSIDATPLFVMVGAELLRWGVQTETILGLIPHFDQAMAWMDEFGDRDGDGYIEYERLSPDGPPNQGWKDSVDSIRHADGEMASTPIALCEVQGYSYAAYLARARLADVTGDTALVDRYRDRAASLKQAFNRDFWSEQSGRYVMALDGHKKQIDVLASNIGHCLWTGIIDDEHAPQVARDLLSDQMSTGWGLRTLASSNATYNPVSYHSGSVWPHDTAIAAAGLRRYGFIEESNRLALDVFDLAAADDGRLPELVAGFSRDEFRDPVPYPTSCSPQAWAAASPLLLLRTLLGLEPDLHSGTIGVDPQLPVEVGRLRVEGIPMGDERVTIGVENGNVSVTGVPAGVNIVRGAVE